MQWNLQSIEWWRNLLNVNIVIQSIEWWRNLLNVNIVIQSIEWWRNLLNVNIVIHKKEEALLYHLILEITDTLYEWLLWNVIFVELV